MTLANVDFLTAIGNHWTPRLVCLLLLLFSSNAHCQNAIGVRGHVGCLDNPKQVNRLRISKSGVYENFLIDSHWEGGNRVKITANDVTLRNCEIRNATGNGIGVYGKNVTIENCKIHHLLNSTFDDQKDAHGITGIWSNVTIRNCEICYVSGDCIQFDPGRTSTGKLMIENCTLWTGPLPGDAAGFNAGQRPGENAFDSKTQPDGQRCQLVIRKCLMYGWNQPAQINNMSAINLKENVHAVIENCLFTDNEISMRLRGPTGRGDARVHINSSAIFDSAVGIRMEDKLRDLKIRNLGFGEVVSQKYKMVNGPFPGYDNQQETAARPFDEILKNGWK